jgi:RHS repeat-associated protein
MKNNKSLLITASLIFFSIVAQAQSKTINLSSSITGNQNFEARDTINLNSGFIYTATTGSTFTANINEALVFNAEYLSSVIAAEGRSLNTSAPVSTAQGSAGVSPTGAATYQIPIFTPDGIAGIQPNISIVYNSQGGDGILGRGWDISGLSVISRVPRTIFNDGSTGGVDFNQSDKYSLDGNRLLAYSGSYGAENSIYETEVKTFSKIESFGLIKDSYNFGLTKKETGPSNFKVTTKDGKIIEYGNSDDSKVIPGVNNLATSYNGIFMWRINKITDLNGNYMKFTYKNLNGESVIEKIDYTGNSSSTTVHSIQFFYDKKSDSKSNYIDGRKIGNALLLRMIKVITEGTIIRTYDFDYFVENNKTYLNVVSELGNDGKGLNSTVVEWGIENTTIIPNLTSIDIPNDKKSDKDKYWTSGDVNGDGINDLISFYDIDEPIPNTNQTTPAKIIQVFQSTPTFNGDVSFVSMPSLKSYDLGNVYIDDKAFSYGEASLVCNINGDNLPDIVVPRFIRDVTFPEHKILNFYFYILNNNAVIKQKLLTDCDQQPVYSISDLNNDGIDDIVFIEKSKSGNSYPGKIRYGTNNFDDTKGWVDFNVDLSSLPKRIFISDFNLDGLKDILVISENGYTFFQNIGTNSTMTNGAYSCVFNSPSNYTDFNGNYSVIKPGDFNGDGLTDFILNEHCNSKWHLALNNGNWGFIVTDLSNITAVEESFTDYNNDKDECIVTDFNHDGKSDVIIIDAVYHKNSDISGSWGVYDKTNINWYTSNGSGFDKVKSLSVTNSDYTFGKLNCLGDFDGDGLEDLLSYGSDLYNSVTKDDNFRVYRTYNNNFEGGLVKTISDGLNRNTTFTYQPLTYNKTSNGTDFYTKGSNSTYPILDIQAPLYCVSSVSVPDGVGGTSTTNYSYTAARTHLTGKGFLGFSGQTVRNLLTKIVAFTNTELDDNYFLKKQTLEIKTLSNSAISKSESVYENTKSGNTYFSHQTSNKTTNNLTGVITTTTYEYTDDAYKNISSVIIDYGGGFKQTTTYTDYTNAGSWIPNKPQQVTVSNKHPDDGASFSSATRYSYDNKGNIKTQIDNYGVSGKQVTTSYSNYDAWGHPTIVTITASSEGGAVNRSKTFTYDNKGRFITSVKDELGTTSYDYDATYGTLIKTTSPTGLKTEYKYDCLGRLLLTTLPDGNQITNKIDWFSDGKPVNAFYYSQTKRSGRPYLTEWYDKMGRKVGEETQGYNGMLIYSETTFNAKGQVTQKAAYSNGSLTEQVNYTYYNDGRVNTESYSSGKSVSYSYSGTQVSVNINGRTTSTTYDNWGAIKSVTEPSPGGKISYTYYSNGKPKTINSPVSTVSMEYDDLGYQKKLTDPDAGTMEYRYDAIGRLTYQKDAKLNETRLFYDNLSRLDYKQNKNGIKITDYEYYTNGNGLGQIKKVSSSNGSYDSYEYDNLGRQYKTTRHIDASISDIVFQNHFDAYGNIDQIIYPGGFIVTQQYDDFGNLKRVINDNITIWQLNTLDATKMNYTLGNGQVTEKVFDNNGFLSSIKTNKGTVVAQGEYYTFDETKDLLTIREDRRAGYGLKETFAYDNLDRLTGWNVYKNSTLTSSYGLNYRNDKIMGKTDVGNYFYNGSTPHAVSSVVTSGVTGYTPVAQTVVYNDNGKVSSITEGINVLNITYGPDEQRIKTVLSKSGSVSSTSYFAGLYEAKQDVGTYIKEYFYIMGGDGIAAVVIKIYGTSTTYYIHKNHLGSVVCLTDASGAIKEQMNYDPWGRRRNPVNWSFSNVTLPTILSRGFTGHEHLDVFTLINMNGRVYDPILGMFITCDNFVQDPFNSLSFNRYAYCINNPLKYTDPTGDFFWIPVIMGAIIGAELNGMMSEMNGGNFWDGAWKGAIVGAVGGALSNFGGGSFIYNVLWGTGEGAVTGGLSAVLNNEDIEKGMLWGAAIGFAFAFGQSTIESINNYHDYGMFETNDGVFNKMADDAFTGNSTTGTYSIDPVKAQKALDFWQIRNGGPSLSFAPGQLNGNTDLYGKIKIGEGAFVGGHNAVREQISHEMGHYLKNVNWDKKLIGGKVLNPTFINKSSQYGGDGIYGYNGAIEGAGKFHTGLKMVSSNTYYRPGTLWYISNPYRSNVWQSYGMKKWFYLLPNRF